MFTPGQHGLELGGHRSRRASVPLGLCHQALFHCCPQKATENRFEIFIELHSHIGGCQRRLGDLVRHPSLPGADWPSWGKQEPVCPPLGVAYLSRQKDCFEHPSLGGDRPCTIGAKDSGVKKDSRSVRLLRGPQKHPSPQWQSNHCAHVILSASLVRVEICPSHVEAVPPHAGTRNFGPRIRLLFSSDQHQAQFWRTILCRCLVQGWTNLVTGWYYGEVGRELCQESAMAPQESRLLGAYIPVVQSEGGREQNVWIENSTNIWVAEKWACIIIPIKTSVAAKHNNCQPATLIICREQQGAAAGFKVVWYVPPVPLPAWEREVNSHHWAWHSWCQCGGK